MELTKSLRFEVSDLRCHFGPLHEATVCQELVDDLKAQRRYIDNIPTDVSVVSQKRYIKNIRDSDQNCIFGLFVNDKLVGTAGVQLSYSEEFQKDIDTQGKTIATVGILVFKESHQGKGLGTALVWAATTLFHENMKINWFGAGFHKNNLPSRQSFLSCGYKYVANEGPNDKVMLEVSDLVKPESIKHILVRENVC